MTKSRVDDAIAVAESLVETLTDFVATGIDNLNGLSLAEARADIAEIRRRVEALEAAQARYIAAIAADIPAEWRAMVTNEPPLSLQ